jgi:hypothetical protein
MPMKSRRDRTLATVGVVDGRSLLFLGMAVFLALGVGWQGRYEFTIVKLLRPM